MLKILKTMYQEARPWLFFLIFAAVTAWLFSESNGEIFSNKNGGGFLFTLFILYFFGGISWQILDNTMETREKQRKNKDS